MESQDFPKIKLPISEFHKYKKCRFVKFGCRSDYDKNKYLLELWTGQEIVSFEWDQSDHFPLSCNQYSG